MIKVFICALLLRLFTVFEMISQTGIFAMVILIAVARSEFYVGQRIEGQWLGHLKVYPGVISAVESNNKYSIDYDDGDKEYHVAEHLIHPYGQGEDAVLAQKLSLEHRLGGKFFFELREDIKNVTWLIDRYKTQIKNPSGDVDGNAHFELSLFQGNFGVRPRVKGAMNVSWDYLVRAAERGHPAALHRLATAYFTGVYGRYTVPIDFGRSLMLDQMAALQGTLTLLHYCALHST